MSYIDKEYVLTQIKESELDNLTKDQDGTPNDDNLTLKIVAAENLVNGYLDGHVKTLPIPEDKVPEIIKQFMYFIVLYFLHDRIDYNDIPKRVKDNYDAAIFYFKDVSEGNVKVFGLDSGEDTTPIDFCVDPSIFNRGIF